MRVLLVLAVIANLAATVPDHGTPPETDVTPRPTEALRPPLVRAEMLVLGDEPRQALRLRPTVGQRHRIDLVIERLHNRMGEDGTRPLERPLPLRTRLVSEVTAVDDRGNATASMVIESSVAQPGRLHSVEEAESMRVAARALVGLRMELTVSEFGQLISLSWELPEVEDADHADAAQRQIRRVAHGVTRLFPSLPEEPVGDGARWRTFTPERFESIDRTDTSNFTLDFDEHGVVRLARRTHVVAPAGPGDPEVIPGAPQVQMVHYSGFGEGLVVRRLDELVPRSVRDEVISTTRTSGRIAGERINVHDQIFVRVDARAETIEDETERPRRRVGE